MRFIIAAFGTIFLLILLIVFLFNRDNSPQPAVTQQPAQLVEYATKNSSVSQLTVGPVVGEEEQRSINIVVTPSERRLEILSGFGQTVVSTQSFPNTQVAYEAFLSALGGQDFLRSKETPVKDPRSVCPTGNRFEYMLLNDSQQVSNLWSVSCDRTGTFNGQGPIIRSLFQAQIPDYSTLVGNVNI